jgi:hypothetical protein
MRLWVKRLRLFNAFCDNAKQSIRQVAHQTGVCDHGVDHAGWHSYWVIQLRSGVSPLNRHAMASTRVGNDGRPRMRQV